MRRPERYSRPHHRLAAMPTNKKSIKPKTQSNVERKIPLKLHRRSCVAALALGSLAVRPGAVETYDMTRLHTWVGFHRLALFSTKVPGYFRSERTVVVDRDHLTNSTVEASLQWPAHQPEMSRSNYTTIYPIDAVTRPSHHLNTH